MIIDISSYNGKIDFKKMAQDEVIERVILRGTTKNGKIDTRFMENLNGVLTELNDNVAIDVYKFSYATNFERAYYDCVELLVTLWSLDALKFINTIWLDLEPFDGHTHTEEEIGANICAYANICRLYGVSFGVYCNYSYLKNIVPKWAKKFDFWVARWNGILGDTFGYNVKLWQYTSKGRCAGITGDVDISKEVNR